MPSSELRDRRESIATPGLLLGAVGGVLPGADRWAKVWEQVSFAVDRSEPKQPTLRAVWPDGPATDRVYTGRPISLDCKDGKLQDIWRLFADITGFNVVVYPGVRGEVTFATADEPWDRVLERIVAASGLAHRVEDNVLLISQPQQLPRPRRFSGQRVDMEFRNRDLVEALAEIAAAGGATLVVDPAVRGRVTLLLKQVRWDQAFDTVVGVNNLEWTRGARPSRHFPGDDEESLVLDVEHCHHGLPDENSREASSWSSSATVIGKRRASRRRIR